MRHSTYRPDIRAGSNLEDAMRYVVTIRKPEQPTTYYLSRNGFRCYSAGAVAVFHSEQEAREERDHFAPMMREFVLAVERLPAGVRNVGKALLSAAPVS